MGRPNVMRAGCLLQLWTRSSGKQHGAVKKVWVRSTALLKRRLAHRHLVSMRNTIGQPPTGETIRGSRAPELGNAAGVRSVSHRSHSHDRSAKKGRVIWSIGEDSELGKF